MDQTIDISGTTKTTKEVATVEKARKRKKISGADLAFRICNGLFMIIFVVVLLFFMHLYYSFKSYMHNL